MHTVRARSSLLTLGLLLGLIGSSAAQGGAKPRERLTCHEPGRRTQCTFTLVFDASRESFVQVQSHPRGNDTARRTLPLPLDRFSLPVLTGDILVVEVRNLPYGDRVTAGAQTTPVDPFPRPELDETFSLTSVALKSFATPELVPSVRAEQAGEGLVTASAFDRSPDDFRAFWTSTVRAKLAAASEDLLKQVQSITPEVRRTLSGQATTIKNSGGVLVSHMGTLVRDLDASTADLRTRCIAADSKEADANCVPLLYQASSIVERQTALQRSLRQLVGVLELESAVKMADSISRIIQNPATPTILGTDLSTAQKYASSRFQAFAKPKEPTAEELEAARKILATSEVAKELAADAEAEPLQWVQGLAPERVLMLRSNLMLANEDLAALERYALLRRLLPALSDDTRSALADIETFRKGFDDERVKLALAANHLAFAFDGAAARPGGAVLIPVFRTTDDEEVDVTLTRTPRFAALPVASTLPRAAGSSGGKVAAADGKAETKESAPAARTYTERLRARQRHHFQLIAGFVFSTIESSTYGTLDVIERRDEDGDGDQEDVAMRRITRTADRPRMFVPAAQLVFHPLGKDVHPDAYRTSSALIPGIALGSTLDAPVQNFSVGLALEPLPGMHLSGGRLWSQVPQLQPEFEEGDLIAATASAPTRDKFQDGWYVGGMLDIGVFTSFFGKLLGIGG